MWLVASVAAAGVAVPGVVFAQAGGGQPPSLWEYGVVGAMAFLAIGAVRVLWTQTTKASSETLERVKDSLERERARSDRLEDELRKQNALIQERIITALVESNRVVQETMALTRGQR